MTTQVQTTDQAVQIQEVPQVAVNSGDLVVLSPEQQKMKQQMRAEVDLNNYRDANQVIFYGVSDQKAVTDVADKMLNGVRNKDVGSAGSALNDMMLEIRGLSLDDVKNGKEPGWFGRLLGAVSPLAAFLQKYETVQDQVEKITTRIEVNRNQLITDVTMLDRLYDATLDHFRALEVRIVVAQEIIQELTDKLIPAAEARAASSSNILDAQEVRDLSNFRDDWERRLHDLKLTRQVTMQALPSIRITQDNDKNLINKLQSAVVNTIPLWKQQMAHALTLHNTRSAAKVSRDVSDLTNEMLTANAAELQTANREVRKEIERGILDIESVEKANQMLIDTINESLEIAEQGKKYRAEADTQMSSMEKNLRATLAKASTAGNAV